MVLSILIAAIVAPGLLGSQEAIRQSQSKEKREEHRARRCNLIATCVKSSNRSRVINDRQVVLKNGKLWIDTGTEDGGPLGHPYAGYYLPYPDTKYEGLVTTITDVAPVMNWVYIDKETHEIRYGVRADAQPNLTGPFDCTRQDRRLIFDGWEGFCAVEQAPGLWGLYFDVHDDGLKGKVAPGTRVLEIELSRKEKRFQKEKKERQADQTTKREVDVKEEAPVDRPLGAEALVSKPGVVDAQIIEQIAESAPLRPLKIPESIFDDPPKMVEPLVFRPSPTPKTPPPAYSPTAGDEPLQPVSTRDTGESTAFTSGTTQDDPPPTLDNTLPLNTSVTLPATLQYTSASEKRTTPKLNRNSGTRALAQAQRFEAMAAAQQPSTELQRRTSRPVSRANSNTSSVYSNRDEALAEPSVIIQSQVSPEPAPLVVGVSQAKASAGSGAVLDRSVRQPITPPRQRAPSVPKVAAASGAGFAGSARATPPTRRPSALATTRLSTQRSTSQSFTPRPTSNRQRERSASEQSSYPAYRSFQTPSRINPTLGRQSLAKTMTTGKGSQGMSNRLTDSKQKNGLMSNRPVVGQNRLRAATVGRKTTSALIRDIDVLVSQDTSAPTGGAGDSSRYRWK
jgi:hypothetical protein